MQNFGEWEYPYCELDKIQPDNTQLKTLEQLMVNQPVEMQAQVTLMFINSPSYLQVAELIAHLHEKQS